MPALGTETRQDASGGAWRDLGRYPRGVPRFHWPLPRPFAMRSRYASPMDILKMLAELRQEHAAIEEAILVLERLAGGRGRRPGRPPAWMKAATPMPQKDAEGPRVARTSQSPRA